MKFFYEYRDEIVLILIIVASLLFLFFQNFGNLTGQAIQGEVPSNVTVSKYLAIQFGTSLGEGIQFGNVAFLPVTNVNASHNYDNGVNGTTYTIDVSNDSNTAVDFCILANAGLTSPTFDVIGLGNETYSAYNSTNSTYPLITLETPMTLSYVKAVNNIHVGNSSYWRFWLDVPTAQPSGDYNNTVSFKGVQTGQSC